MENMMTNRTTAELFYIRHDLTTVIAVQEQTERAAPGSCPKLGQYNDELLAVAGEIRRRQNEVR